MSGLLGLMLLTLSLASCVTVADVPNYKNEGVARTYPVTYDEAWVIARTIFRWEGVDAIEERRQEGYMLTSTGAGLFHYGAVMGAWIEKVDEASTRVIVVTKRRVQTNIFTPLTETTFHRRFAEAVETIKAGRPLQKPEQ
jgi:hypothetical protein